MTTYTYRLKAIDSGFYAQCCEMDHAAAEGDTAEETVASLRKAIAERLAESDGMVPPSVKPLLPAFSLVEAAPPEGPSSPQGPGEAR
jgi:predicted RNase H-like HicB family nuclease